MAQRDQNYTTATERFVRLSVKFFDCLNVSNVCDGERKRISYLGPYNNNITSNKFCESISSQKT